jgi:hypothetical protein
LRGVFESVFGEWAFGFERAPFLISFIFPPAWKYGVLLRQLEDALDWYDGCEFWFHGYKSGRSFCLDTPLATSSGIAFRAGTLPLFTQYCTACWLTPSFLAVAVCPPNMSTAWSRAIISLVGFFITDKPTLWAFCRQGNYFHKKRLCSVLALATFSTWTATRRQKRYKGDDMPTLTDLETALKSHDWYSEYSDDYRAWKQGWDESLRIKAMLNQLAFDGLGSEAQALYNKYAPAVK